VLEVAITGTGFIFTLLAPTTLGGNSREMWACDAKEDKEDQGHYVTGEATTFVTTQFLVTIG
jgi:hypothetical protein